MNIDTWLEVASADVDRRGLPQLKPLLTALARSTRVLRAADWNESAAGEGQGPTEREHPRDDTAGGGTRR